MVFIQSEFWANSYNKYLQTKGTISICPASITGGWRPTVCLQLIVTHQQLTWYYQGWVLNYFPEFFFPPEFPSKVIRTAKLIVTTILYLKEQIYHGLRLFYCKYTCCHFRQDSIIDDLNIKFSPGYYYRRGCNILTINTFKQKMNITLKKKTNAFSLYHWKLWKSE